MNQEQIDLVCVVMEMIGGTIDHMDEDQFHAPAKWVLNNWWHTLNVVLTMEGRSEVGNQADTKLNSLEATDQTESKKGDEHIQTDQPFKV